MQEKLAALPGAQSAALMSQLPGVGSNGGQFGVYGTAYSRDLDLPTARWIAVSPGFFETFDIGVLRGRGIGPGDRVDSDPVAVVNRALANRFFAGKDPIGGRIRQAGAGSSAPWMTIVGIVPTTFSGDPNAPRDPAYYVPLSQHYTGFVSMAVRTQFPLTTVTAPIRAAVAELNRDMPIFWVYSMEAAIARPTWYIRGFGTMFMICGAIALFLASVGLYAVMSFAVSGRTKELGIRMALGATSTDVIGMILRQGARQVVIGLVLGLGLAGAIAQVMQVVLFDVQPRDPAIFAGVAVVLAAAGALACLVRAWRATRTDALAALRRE